jgi:putative acetyltransferase
MMRTQPTSTLSRSGGLVFSARRDGVMLGVGALKRIDDAHAEVKPMQTSAAARGRGVGTAMVRHLLSVGADEHEAR